MAMMIITVLMAMACVAYADVDIQPAPPSIGADIPLSYFGPAPSSVDPRLVGPVQLLKSGTIDTSGSIATITLPIYYGYTVNKKNGTRIPYLYILTDTTDHDVAAALGVNPSSKLKFAIQPGAYRTGKLDFSNVLTTDMGWVDFTPARSIVAGDAPNYFPPKSFVAGSRGMDGYSPLVLMGGDVYNMPIIADARDMGMLKDLCKLSTMSAKDKAQAKKYVHDKVINLCLNPQGNGGTVTLELTTGFSFGKPVLYLSTDANSDVPAAFEAVTLAPGLAYITVGADDSLFSAVERLFTIVNGYNNGDINPKNRSDGPKPKEMSHPLRQGLGSALRDGGGPLNILGGIPTVATDYSPLWDLNIGKWTDYAVANNYRTRIIDEFTYLGMAERGYITTPSGTPLASSGAVVNCPIAMRFL